MDIKDKLASVADPENLKVIHLRVSHAQARIMKLVCKHWDISSQSEFLRRCINLVISQIPANSHLAGRIRAIKQSQLEEDDD